MAESDQGLSTLVMLLRCNGVAVEDQQIRHCRGTGVIGIPEMLRCAKEFGLKARARRTGWPQLAHTPLPAIAALRDGGFLLLGRASTDKAIVQRVCASRPVPPALALARSIGPRRMACRT